MMMMVENCRQVTYISDCRSERLDLANSSIRRRPGPTSHKRHRHALTQSLEPVVDTPHMHIHDTMNNQTSNGARHNISLHSPGVASQLLCAPFIGCAVCSLAKFVPNKCIGDDTIGPRCFHVTNDYKQTSRWTDGHRNSVKPPLLRQGLNEAATYIRFLYLYDFWHTSTALFRTYLLALFLSMIVENKEAPPSELESLK